MLPASCCQHHVASIMLHAIYCVYEKTILSVLRMWMENVPYGNMIKAWEFSLNTKKILASNANKMLPASCCVQFIVYTKKKYILPTILSALRMWMENVPYGKMIKAWKFPVEISSITTEEPFQNEKFWSLFCITRFLQAVQFKLT